MTPTDAQKQRAEDATFKADGSPFQRFYLWRVEDETGISRTGRVLEGVLTQSGEVIVQWRPPLTSTAIYKDFDTFMAVHVTCHPSKNEVRWIDDAGAAVTASEASISEAVAEERERCATVAEDCFPHRGACNCMEIAAKIREGA